MTGSPIVRRLRARLVQRIYFAGVVQFVVVAAGILALARQTSAPTFVKDTLSFIASTLTAESESPATLRAAATRIHDTLHWSVAVYDPSGDLVAEGGTFASAAPSLAGGGAEAQVGNMTAPEGTIPLPLSGDRAGRLRYALPLRPPPPAGLGATAALVLFVVGVSSWLTARSLALPLARLSATTKAFGAGDFSARAQMKRSDELGDVARAFDEMAERVAKSIRAERELLANVSHELRTPLQRIHVAVELASEGDATTAQESLAEIAEDLSELERIVDDVLTATRLSLESGTAAGGAVPPLRTEPVELRSLVEKAMARFRTLHPQRAIDASQLTNLPILAADPILLRRVIDNLLENSHKYTEDETLPILLSSWITPTSIAIEVRDHGTGISAEDLERVFEPFFRSDRSRTRATGGFGLGLALARRIVESHGGRLALESEVGVGTRARIELPRRSVYH